MEGWGGGGRMEYGKGGDGRTGGGGGGWEGRREKGRGGEEGGRGGEEGGRVDNSSVVTPNHTCTQQVTYRKVVTTYLLHAFIKESIGRVLSMCEGPVLNKRAKQLKERHCRGEWDEGMEEERHDREGEKRRETERCRSDTCDNLAVPR